MKTEEITALQAETCARAAQKHIGLARKRGACPEFVRWLRNGKQRYVDALIAVASKLACIGLVCVLLSGCGATLHGIMVDSEENAGRMRRWSQPNYNKKQSRREYQTDQDYKARVDLAADLVLADRQR